MVYRSTRLFKRSLSLLLTIFLILPILTTTAYSAEYNDNATQGSNTDADTMTSYGFSASMHQGYRISILSGDKPFPGVEKPVQDMWYATPPSMDKYFDTNRLGMQSTGFDNIIGKDNLEGLEIPRSILADIGGLISNGIAVREYLLNGTAGPGAGGPGGSGGPTINWGTGGSSVSTIRERYGIDAKAESHAIQISRYYANKLKKLYDFYISRGCSLSPSEFQGKLKDLAILYRSEVEERYANPADLGLYCDPREAEVVIDALFRQEEAIYRSYAAKYKLAHNSQSVPRAGGEEGGGSGEVPLTLLIKALFSDGTDAGIEKLINDINADPEFRVLLETIVWYYPHTNSALGNKPIRIKVAGTAKNIAEFNSASASLLGGTGGGYMANLTNKALPKGLMTERDDTVLNILMPTDPGSGSTVATPAIMSNYGWGTHIYDKNSAGTHTYDRDTYPDGTPGPAPDPGAPGNPGDTPDPEDPASPGDPSTPNNGYNITIIKFYESNNQPESNFTREHNPGTIQVEDEPIYHLVDWFYSPDKLVPTSQSTVYDDTKVQALVTGTGTSEATVNVVTPDTTLYLKLVKQDKAPANPTQQFILKESEVTKAYNSQQVQAGASWPTGDIFHWAGDSLGSGKCTAIIGYTCDCDDDDCSGCVQLTFPCSTDIIQKRN